MKKQFNLHNPTEARMLNILANGEGIITADEFKRYANSTMLSKYKTAGYIKQMPNAAKGTYEISEKFKTQYRRQVNPAQRFSGSHSPAHAAGVNSVLAHLSPDVPILTGQRIQNTFQAKGRTPEFHRSIALIAERWKEERDLYADIRPASEQEQALLHSEASYANDRYHAAANEEVSTPDFGVTLTKEQLHAFGSAIHQQFNGDYSPFFQKLHDTTTYRLLELEKSAQAAYTVFVEIVTDNYTKMDVFQKELWAEATDSIILYIPA